MRPISYFEDLAVDRLLLDAEGKDVGSAIELMSWGCYQSLHVICLVPQLRCDRAAWELTLTKERVYTYG